jgi:hypothetical protein
MSELQSHEYVEKEVKKTTLNIPKTLNVFDKDINTIVDSTDKIIKNYLEQNIYTNKIPTEVSNSLNTIFETCHANIKQFTNAIT